MYSAEFPFSLLEILRIQEGPSKQMMENFEKAVFQKIEKREAKKSQQVTFLQTMPFKNSTAWTHRKLFYLDPFGPLCSKLE